MAHQDNSQIFHPVPHQHYITTLPEEAEYSTKFQKRTHIHYNSQVSQRLSTTTPEETWIVTYLEKISTV